ncbi:uracil-DNA glycosylase [bacterium c-19]|nr:uracil-DNA glycosylase [bacterium c-19]
MKWETWLKQEQEQAYYQELMQFLDQEYQEKQIFPPRSELFSAFQYCDMDQIKVVILGQDPYHEKNQAHGLAFSVRKGIKIPPSLRNIYKELHDDLNIAMPSHGCLIDWAKQGVFMLNAVLSVQEGKAGSHHNKGWETFTDHVIQTVNEQCESVVFVLWGAPAQRKQSLIDSNKHAVLCAPHPSPLSAYRGFFGSKPFSQINDYLKAHQREEINWEIHE